MALVLSEFFDEFPKRVTPEKLGAWKACVELDITGDGGGRWVVCVSDGKMEISRDSTPTIDTSIGIAAGDLQHIIAGKLNPQLAFMTGKLKVKGVMGNALKLSSLLTRP